MLCDWDVNYLSALVGKRMSIPRVPFISIIRRRSVFLPVVLYKHWIPSEDIHRYRPSRGGSPYWPEHVCGVFIRACREQKSWSGKQHRANSGTRRESWRTILQLLLRRPCWAYTLLASWIRHRRSVWWGSGGERAQPYPWVSAPFLELQGIKLPA